MHRCWYLNSSKNLDAKQEKLTNKWAAYEAAGADRSVEDLLSSLARLIKDKFKVEVQNQLPAE